MRWLISYVTSEPVVVIRSTPGTDARPEFALDTARAVVAAGGWARVLPVRCPPLSWPMPSAV